MAKWALIAPAVLALTLIANGAYQASNRGTLRTQASKALDEVYEKAPFTVRLPTSPPDRARMVRVYMKEPDSKRGFQAYQVNVWYDTPGSVSEGGGRTVHVWQSNDKFLARRLIDPSNRVGEEETIGGASWHRVTDDRVRAHVVTTFSRHFDDGVTMTVDSGDPDLARATIAGLSERRAAVL